LDFPIELTQVSFEEEFPVFLKQTPDNGDDSSNDLIFGRNFMPRLAGLLTFSSILKGYSRSNGY
jgi:hypothetical protein